MPKLKKVPTAANIYDIASAAKRMNLTPSYVRTLIRRGRLESIKVPLAADSLVTRHEITEKVITEYLQDNGVGRRNSRGDKRNKYVFYMSRDEHTQVMEVLKAAGLGDIASTIRTWNNLKPVSSLLNKETDDDV